MSLKDLIVKKPLILVGVLFVILGIILFVIGQATLQQIFTIIIFILILLSITISVIVTYLTYKKYERVFDFSAITLFFGVLFIFFTLILLLFLTISETVYSSIIDPKLSPLAFPIAIFALGISLYYFFDGQFSSEKKLDQIILKLTEIEKNSIQCRIANIDTNQITTPSPKKDYSTISDEDKIVIEHLFDRHKNLLSYVDAVDTKLAQIIALNGLILSFIMFASGSAKHVDFFYIGIILIIASMLTGALGYYSRNFYPGVDVKFFKDYDSFQNGEGIIKLIKQLSLDIQRNEKKLECKANIFNIMLFILILGLIVVLGGYYV